MTLLSLELLFFIVFILIKFMCEVYDFYSRKLLSDLTQKVSECVKPQGLSYKIRRDSVSLVLVFVSTPRTGPTHHGTRPGTQDSQGPGV